MQQIIEGIRYDTDKATLIAHDRTWDGHNMDRNGRNLYLYRTPKGCYFLHIVTRWQGETDHITPQSLEDALDQYERLSAHELYYEEAFPGLHPEEG